MSSMRNDTQVDEQSQGQDANQSSLPRTGLETSAPIAKVLNNDAPVPHPPQYSNVAHSCSTTPFSGRLIDLLLDTPEQATSRERSEYPLSEIRPTESSYSVIQLPKLPQLAAKKTQRPRIPPLLQGLHQPPPLPPSNRLFPPITGDKNAFAGSARDRGCFDPRPGLTKASNATIASNFDKSHEKSELVPTNTVVQTLTTHAIDGSKHTSSSTEKVMKSKDEASHRSGRKRRKWSEQETKDLLVGVSRFGIGSWKKILHSPDFNFYGRTAVDLKDRFRVCCPGETTKTNKKNLLAKSNLQKQQTESPSMRLPSFAEVSTNEYQGSGGDNLPPPESPPAKKQKASEPSTILSQMAEIGVQGPFLRRSRRPQCKFSAQDDVNLLQGFEKYGSVWHAIRDDADLGFNNRHPTDLRDRFRIRYPEKFAKAGHKLKAKRGSIVAHQHATSDGQGKHADVHSPSKSTPPQSDKRSGHFSSDMERVARPSDQIPDTTFCSPTNHTPRSNDTTPYTFNPFPMMFDDYGSLEHDEFSNSPIILNRDILQWADGNHTSTYNQVTTWPASQGPSTDPAFNSLPHTATRSNNTLHHPSTSMNAAAIDIRGNPTTSPSNVVTTGAASTTTTTKIDMLKTPNLPTIVYPHVPVASARNTLHNLPTPADLLSGVEDDALGGFMM